MIGFDDIAAALAEHGLIPRGGFHPAAADGVPGGPGTLVLAGTAGPAMWRAFEQGRRDEANPLDSWTRRVLTAVAGKLGATALFPFAGPPWLPFQRWAMRADAAHPSPIGLLIHPDFGLWHAYRGALAFQEKLALPARDERGSPCDACRDKPCLTSCPVGAFKRPEGGESGVAFRSPLCVGHLAGEAGKDCLNQGCRARRACPIGQSSYYGTAQASHHMTAFFKANRGPEGSAKP